MTTQQDFARKHLVMKCQNPQWAAACIAGLEGEVKKLEAQILAVKDALCIYTNSAIAVGEPMESVQIGNLQVVDSVLAALHPQEPTL